MPEYEAPQPQFPFALPAPPAQFAYPLAMPLNSVDAGLRVAPAKTKRKIAASILRKELRSGSAKATAIYKPDRDGNPRLVFVLDRFEHQNGATPGSRVRRTGSVLEIITLVGGRLQFHRVDRVYPHSGQPVINGQIAKIAGAQTAPSFLLPQLCPLRGRIPVVDRGASPRCKLNAALWKFYQAVGLPAVREAYRCYRATWNEASINGTMAQPSKGWVLLANILKCPELAPALRRLRLAGGKAPEALFASCRWTASSLRQWAAWVQERRAAYGWFYEPESAQIALGSGIWRYIQMAPHVRAESSHSMRPAIHHRSDDLRSAKANITEKQVRALTRMKRWKLVQWLLKDRGQSVIDEPAAKLAWRMMLKIDQTATNGAVDIAGVAGLAIATLRKDAKSCGLGGWNRLGKLLLHEDKVSWNALWGLCGTFQARDYPYISNTVIREMMHEKAGVYLIPDTARMLAQLGHPAGNQAAWPKPRDCAALQRLHDDCMKQIDAVQAALDQTPYDISGWIKGMDTADFCIEPLATPALVRAEGALMHHCVGAYKDEPHGKTLALYRMLRPERATVMLNKGYHANPDDEPWRLVQAYGVCNAVLKEETMWVIRRWIENRI